MIPFLIHGGHIRLLHPKDRNAGLELAREITLAGKADREWVTVGWREVLEGEDPAAPLVPSKRPKCTRCQEQQENKVGNKVPRIPWSFEEHETEAQERILAQGHQPLQDRPAFAYGIVAQEVFAGSGGWSKAMKEAGHHVLEPIEVYEDPMRQKGYKASHDVKDPDVRRRLIDQAKELPGPQVPNVYHLGTPCTSYCDFNLLNGGTRTFDQPRGNPDQLTPTEEDGNLFCDFTCDLCLEAYNHDKEFVIENTMPTGRYPKLWDQPAVQRLQRATGALFVPAHLCEWGLSPPDQPEKRYKKGQWNLVSPGVYAYALLLARPCQRQHQHEQVKGSATNGSYPRTREAQVYPPALCKAWAIVYTAAHKGWGPRPIRTRLAKLAEPQQQQGGGQRGTQRRKHDHPLPEARQGRPEEIVGGDEDRGGEAGDQAEDQASAEGPEGGEGDAAIYREPCEDAEGTAEREDEAAEGDDGREGDAAGDPEDDDTEGPPDGRVDEAPDAGGPGSGEAEGSDEMFWSGRSDSSDNPPPGDEWTWDPVEGRLWRWHRHERTEQFGHRLSDWEDSPIPPEQISNYRKTVIFRGGRRIGAVMNPG